MNLYRKKMNSPKSDYREQLEIFLKLSELCEIFSNEISIRKLLKSTMLGIKARMILNSKLKLSNSLPEIETAYRFAIKDWFKQSDKLINICKSTQTK